MASQVLMFPTDASHRALARRARRHPAAGNLLRDSEVAEPAELGEATGRHNLQLVYCRSRISGDDASETRTPDTRTQAQRIAAQVERELAGRVQREAAERRTGGRAEGQGDRRLPSSAERSALSAGLPPQVTEIGLRHRILDALLFFARPA